MKSLIIDTSHETSYLIFAENNDIIFFKRFEKTNLSKELFENIDNILKQTDTDISELKYIAAAIGPGSFTGLRVGAVICKTFNFAKKIPIIGYESLKAYTPLTPGNFLTAFDAKSDGVYLIQASCKNDKVQYTSEPKLLCISDAQKLFSMADSIISPDAEALKEKFKDHKNKFTFGFFDPQKVLNMANLLYKKKNFKNFQTFNLLYLRGPNHIEQ